MQAHAALEQFEFQPVTIKLDATSQMTRLGPTSWMIRPNEDIDAESACHVIDDDNHAPRDDVTS